MVPTSWGHQDDLGRLNSKTCGSVGKDKLVISELHKQDKQEKQIGLVEECNILMYYC